MPHAYQKPISGRTVSDSLPPLPLRLRGNYSKKRPIFMQNKLIRLPSNRRRTRSRGWAWKEWSTEAFQSIYQFKSVKLTSLVESSYFSCSFVIYGHFSPTTTTVGVPDWLNEWPWSSRAFATDANMIAWVTETILRFICKVTPKPASCWHNIHGEVGPQVEVTCNNSGGNGLTHFHGMYQVFSLFAWRPLGGN